MAEPIRVGVVGCGDITKSRHLDTLVANEHTVIAGICDRHPERVAPVAEQYGVPWVTASAAFLRDIPMDAVIIATPPWSTAAIAIDALELGIDVLCEKPVGMNLEEAEAIARAQDASSALLQVGFVLRHGMVFSSLKEWIEGGRIGIGPFEFLIGVYDERYDPVGDPVHYRRIMRTLEHGAPCVHDGAHTMDHLRYLTGAEATRLSSWGTATRAEFAAPNLNRAVIEFEGGHRARVEIGWFLEDFPPSEWRVIGPEGMVWFDQANATVHLIDAHRQHEQRSLNESWFDDCFRTQMESFVSMVRDRTTPSPGIRDGLESMRLCLAFEAGMKRPYEVVEIN